MNNSNGATDNSYTYEVSLKLSVWSAVVLLICSSKKRLKTVFPFVSYSWVKKAWTYKNNWYICISLFSAKFKTLILNMNWLASGSLTALTIFFRKRIYIFFYSWVNVLKLYFSSVKLGCSWLKKLDLTNATEYIFLFSSQFTTLILNRKWLASGSLTALKIFFRKRIDRLFCSRVKVLT